MSAGTKPIEAPDSKSLPNSRRVYVDGKLPGVRVPFREITQSPSRELDGNLVANPPVRVYDTSGPWGDPDLHCDSVKGLPELRREWIRTRGDVDEDEGREVQPIDDGYLTFAAANRARRPSRSASVAWASNACTSLVGRGMRPPGHRGTGYELSRTG